VAVSWVGDASEGLAASIFTFEVSNIIQDIKPIKDKKKIRKMFE
jgi:hypothetical protein